MESKHKQSRQGHVVSCLRTNVGKDIYVNATSDFKPVVPGETLEKWQRLVDHIASTLRQPHALITRLEHDTLFVFLHNNTPDTTFIDHDKFPLGLGVYCETTMSRDTVNFVPDALGDKDWRDNPSVDFSLISYIGVPIRWPDGELFGTICSLGDSPMPQDTALADDMSLFKSIVETDLHLILEKHEKDDNERHFNTVLCEVHHRIKNHLNILCGLIQLERADNALTREEFVAYQDKLSNQVKAVAQLHTLLAYEDQDSVELSDYLGKMIEGWVLAASDRDIAVSAALDKVVVTGSKVVYIGVLLNELITNSFSHAFGPDNHNPTITMTLKDEGERFRFTYKDNGPGIVPGGVPGRSKSLGITVIRELAESMGGIVIQSNDQGLSFSFVFPRQLD